MSRALRSIVFVSIGGLLATYGWLTYDESAARRVLATASVELSVAESLAATNRVRLALHRIQRAAYDTAGLHLVVYRRDSTMTLERAGTPLIHTAVRTSWPIGIDTIVSVTSDTIRSAKGWVLSTDLAASPTDFRAITRSLTPGAVIYVQ